MDFKLGDTVQVTGNCNSNSYKIGFIGKIIEFKGDGIHARLSDDSYVGNWVDLRFDACIVSRASKSKSISFESIVLPHNAIDAINEALAQTDDKVKDRIFNTWGMGSVLEKGFGISMLFYGPPGTGKTLMAQAIADKLDRHLVIIGAAEIESSEPGGAERALKTYFADAKQNNKVMLFDECDSLIYDRRRVGMILGAQINCLLSELERFDGVAIFTTNNTPCLDKAFERRLCLKLEFPMPNKDLRLKIWQRFFPKPDCLAKDVDLRYFARWRITGGYIKNVVLNAARRAAYLGKEQIDHECLMTALEREAAGHQAFSRDMEYAQTETITETVGADMGQSVTMTKEREDGRDEQNNN